MERLITADKLPADIELSSDIKERTEYYYIIKMNGIDFYVPITKKARLTLGIKKDGVPGSYEKLWKFAGPSFLNQ